MRSFWIILLGFAAVSAVALGQDVRLSSDPINYLLATDLRIQSAASIGPTTLAVWGTAVAGPQQPAGVQGALRFQLLRGGTPVGTQGTLNAPQASPYGVVRVLDLLDRYVVLWNDRRAGAEGIYAQVVDTAGNVVAGELQLSSGAMPADSLVWRIHSSSGWVVVWQDSSAGGSLKEIKMDDAGNPTSSPTLLRAGAHRRGVQFADIPGLLLLQDNGQAAVAFWSDKGVDARPIPAGRFSGPYHLSRDSSLLVLKDSTLAFYDSFFDSVPAKSLAIPFGPGLLPGTQTVVKDDTGGISIIYMRERVGLLDVFYFSHIYRQWIVGDTLGKRDTLAVLKYLDDPHSGFAGFRTKFNWATIDKGFSNTTLITVKFWEEEIYNSVLYNRLPRYSTFALASNGAFIGSYQNAPLPLSLRRLGIGGSPVERRLFDTISSITVVASGTEQTVAAMVAEQVINIPQLCPNVMEREGALLVTYDQSEKKATYPLGVWNTRATPPLQMLPSLSIETYNNYIPTKSDLSQAQLLNGMDHTVLLHNLYERKETAQHGHPTSISYKGWHRYYAATDSGWRMMAQFYHVAGEMVGISSSRLSFYGLDFQFDPEQQRFYGSELLELDKSFLPIDSNRFVYAADRYGTIQWKVVDAPQVYHGHGNDSVKAIIPIGEQEFLAVYPASQRHLKDTVVIAQASFHPAGPKVKYQRYVALRNKRYLRCYSTEAAPTTVQLEVFSHSGKLLDSTSLQFSVPLPRIAIVQNPTDRSLALLYGGAGGAKLTLLSERLRVQQTIDAGNLPLQDSPISSTRDTVGLVAGVFRNDTLFAVWEDLRNGASDIYGTAWQVPATMTAPILPPPAAAIAPTQAVAITAIAPIPCNDQLTVQHHLSEGGMVTFSIMDEMGKVVKQFSKKLPQGLSESTLATDDLFPGTYAVKISSQHGESIMRFLVVR